MLLLWSSSSSRWSIVVRGFPLERPPKSLSMSRATPHSCGTTVTSTYIHKTGLFNSRARPSAVSQNTKKHNFRLRDMLTRRYVSCRPICSLSPTTSWFKRYDEMNNRARSQYYRAPPRATRTTGRFFSCQTSSAPLLLRFRAYVHRKFKKN
jgi:hypothetical protein